MYRGREGFILLISIITASLYFGLVGPMIGGILGTVLFSLYHSDGMYLSFLLNGAPYLLGYLLGCVPIFITGLCFGGLRAKLNNKVYVVIISILIIMVLQPSYLLFFYKGTIKIGPFISACLTMISMFTVFVLIWLKKVIINRI